MPPGQADLAYFVSVLFPSKYVPHLDSIETPIFMHLWVSHNFERNGINYTTTPQFTTSHPQDCEGSTYVHTFQLAYDTPRPNSPAQTTATHVHIRGPPHGGRFQNNEPSQRSLWLSYMRRTVQREPCVLFLEHD